MADVTIQIDTPILTGSDFFKTRYREYPSGSFGANTNRTNAPFTLTGLSAGEYELEVILNKAGVDCPRVLKRFKITEPFTCLTFTASIQYNSAQTGQDVVISYTPSTNPACGWHIEIIGATVNKTVNYATLPASPIKIPVPYEALLVRVIADECNGKSQKCYENDLTPPPPACTPITINSVNIQWVMQIGSSNRFLITFNFTQSVPPTTGMVIGLLQKNVLAGIPGQTGYSQFNPLPVAASATSFSILIDCNSNVFNGFYDIDWFVIDRCNQKFTGTLQIQL